jgi:prepilin-type N-terminal cleavage/methylation domain-containing protein
MIQQRLWDHSGFTLVEVLVAVAMLVIVLGSIYAAFHAGSQSSTMVQESADLNQTARIIQARISSELRSLFNQNGLQGSNIVGEDSADSGLPPHFDNITFTTVSHQPCGKVDVRGDVCTVIYSAECDKEGASLGLYAKEDYTPGLHQTEDYLDSIPATLVSDLVIGMNCTYLDPDTEQWVDSWVDKTAPPTSVRVELILQAHRQGAKPTMVACTTNIPTWGGQQGTTTTVTTPASGGGTAGGAGSGGSGGAR